MNEERKKKFETLNSAYSLGYVPDELYVNNLKNLLEECGVNTSAAKATFTSDDKNRVETLNGAYGLKYVPDDVYLIKLAEILTGGSAAVVTSSSSSSSSSAAPIQTVSSKVVDPVSVQATPVVAKAAPTKAPAPKRGRAAAAAAAVDPDPVPAVAVMAYAIPDPDPVVAAASPQTVHAAVAVAPVRQYAVNAAGKKELDIVLSFDTTGSMTSVIASVRKNLRQLTEMLFANTAFDVKMSVIAHGDYDHAPTLLQMVDFTGNSNTLCAFIDNAQLAQVGWNEGEAYEQVLHRMKTLSWRDNSRKVCVLVGDDLPHEATFPGNTGKVDWAECVATLTARDVSFFSVQCASLSIPRARPFYRALARAHVAGQYVLLDQFYMMPELITGLMLKATDDLVALAELEARMKATGTFNRHMGRAFDILLGRAVPAEEDEEDDGEVLLGQAAKRARFAPMKSFGASSSSGGGGFGRHAGNPNNLAAGVRIPVTPGRFQRLRVDDAVAIKEFVVKTGVVFKTGRGFYELTKKEDVSATKEVVLEELATGDMFTGGEARAILGLSVAGSGNEKINPTAAGINGVYRAFIQSTSYNRKLMPNTWFLYEIDNV